MALKAMNAESIDRVYSVFSGFYDIVYGRFFHKSRAEAVQLLELRDGDRVLEVGVGTGLTLPLYPKSAFITGIDLCAPMLEKGRKRVLQHGMEHVELRQMDAMKMEFEDNTFDSVFAAYVISVVPDPRQVLSEMIRVCKPLGKIVLLNHFQNKNPLISTCERAISPLCTRIGFRADLLLKSLLEGTPLLVERVEAVRPLNYWKVVQCTNRKTAHWRGLNGSAPK